MEVTNSERSTFNRCPRLWKNKYIELIHVKGFSQPLYEGSAFHEAMEILFHPETQLHHMIERVLAYTDPNEFDLDFDKLQIIEARVCAMVTGMWEAWKDERLKYELIAAEKVLQAPIDEGRNFVIGKLDGLVKEKATGKYFIVEYKTSSEDVENPGSMYWIALNMDNQIRQYRYLVKFKYKVDANVLYLVAKKPDDKELRNRIDPETGKRPRIVKRKSETEQEFDIRKAEAIETYAEFEIRLVADYKNNPKDYIFKRKIIIDEKEMDNWTDGMETVIAFMQLCIDRNKFPQSVDQYGTCKKFGRLCEFFNVCTNRQPITDPEFVKKDSRHPELAS